MHFVCGYNRNSYECIQTIGNPMVRWIASCFSMWPYLAWVQPNHTSSQDFARCIPFFVVFCAWTAAKALELLGFGEMHPVFRWGLVWVQPTVGIIKVLWDASCCFCCCLTFGMNANNPYQLCGLGEVHLVFRYSLVCVNAIKTQDILRLAEINHVCCCSLAWMQPNLTNS